MGTPVVHEETSEQFQSGTEYEFMDAYRANQKLGKPHILLYRCLKPIPSDTDTEQLKRVQDFFKRFEGENAEFKALNKVYRSNKEFEKFLFDDLDTVISKDLPRFAGGGIGSISILESINRDRQEDWGEAPYIGNFYGREKELVDLERWSVGDHCRLIAVLGIGGYWQDCACCEVDSADQGRI